MSARVANVVTGLALDREFDYRIPAHLLGRVGVGNIVRIPFGRRRTRGFVTGLAETSLFPELKEIEAVEEGPALFDEPMLRLARWMAGYYAAPFESAIAAILPAAVRREGARHKAQWTARVKPGVTPTPDEEVALARRAPKQAAAWSTLKVMSECTAAMLEARTGVSLAGLRGLEKRGWIEVTREVVRREPPSQMRILPTTPPPLTEEQVEALAAVKKEMEAAAPGVVLVHGVTGSGKTEVYLAAIELALKAGRGAIALVPEISLTPQAMERFRGRFGETVAVLHSHLSDGERHDEWMRIASGEARVVVGARSALFAPVRPLGLLVVDEEHEPAYKQDEAPRYHARDVAVMRGSMEGCAVVLGSATPSLESFRNTQTGKYRLTRLTRRVDHCLMPDVRVVDMRIEAEKAGRAHLLSQPLIEAIRLRLDRAEQTLLFLNRRGFATTIMCPVCGHVETCPNCSIKMTYHRHRDRVLCHVCGREAAAPERCANAECKAGNIKMTGVGTQRVENAVRQLFPKARIERMDSDTTGPKNSHGEILERFRRGNIDILVGTQMIAKGLDYPNVTLVGVILADLSLLVPDFRSAERTFQLLTQVAGRAGRGEIPGEVLMQTYTPFHPAVQCARRADFMTFYDQEIDMRRELGYPPFTRLSTVLFRGQVEKAVTDCANQVAEQLAARLPATVNMTGPMPAPLAKAKGYYRVQCVLRAPATRDYVPLLREFLRGYRPPRGVTISVNVDALSLM